jgi:hypothetical protein
LGSGEGVKVHQRRQSGAAVCALEGQAGAR